QQPLEILERLNSVPFLREGNEPIASSLAVGDCPRTKDEAKRNRGCVKATSQSQASLQLVTAREPKMKRSGIVVASFNGKIMRYRCLHSK
ncbi:MAG: hypothetical protein CVU99_13155, partial [Firmicutes bacterium HGW-Firmicutes-4]